MSKNTEPQTQTAAQQTPALEPVPTLTTVAGKSSAAGKLFPFPAYADFDDTSQVPHVRLLPVTTSEWTAERRRLVDRAKNPKKARKVVRARMHHNFAAILFTEVVGSLPLMAPGQAAELKQSGKPLAFVAEQVKQLKMSGSMVREVVEDVSVPVDEKGFFIDTRENRVALILALPAEYDAMFEICNSPEEFGEPDQEEIRGN